MMVMVASILAFFFSSRFWITLLRTLAVRPQVDHAFELALADVAEPSLLCGPLVLLAVVVQVQVVEVDVGVRDKPWKDGDLVWFLSSGS